MEKEIFILVRIFLGVFFFFLVVIGIIVNIIVVIVLWFRSDFKRKIMNMILISFVFIGFFGCVIDILLVLSIMVVFFVEFYWWNLLFV